MARAQPIVVVDRIGASGWTVSYNIASDKDSGSGGWHATAQCKSIATAKREAARIQAMPKGQWTSPVKIYIVGADAKESQPDPASVPKAPTLAQRIIKTTEDALDDKEKVDLAFWVMNLFEDPEAAMESKGIEEGKKYAPGSVLKEYADSVANSFKSATDLKNNLLQMDKDLLDKSFKTVNDAIGKYNGEVDAGTKLFGKNNPLTKMDPATTETVKLVDDWRDSLKKQFALEVEKNRLDSAKLKLDDIRESIIAEWNSLSANGVDPDPANPKVIRLRNRLNEYRGYVDKYDRLLSEYTAQVTELKESLTKFQSRPQKQGGFVGVWATQSDSYILRVERGGKLYIINTSSAGSLSAGKWSEANGSLQGRTTAVYSGDNEWSTTYGIVYDLAEGSSDGQTIRLKMMTNYLSENGIENPFGRYWNELEFIKVPTDYKHKNSWFMLKHR